MAQMFPDDVEDYEEAIKGGKKVGLLIIEVEGRSSWQISSGKIRTPLISLTNCIFEIRSNMRSVDQSYC